MSEDSKSNSKEDAYELFDWDSYLESTSSEAAPTEAFYQPKSPPVNKFKEGQLILSTDRHATNLMVLSKVLQVYKCWIFIHTEGLDNTHSRWVMCDDRTIQALAPFDPSLKTDTRGAYPPTGFQGNFQKWIPIQLKDKEAFIAPSSSFVYISRSCEPKENLFEVGMKLAAYDETAFDGKVSPATVTKITEKGQVKISFDGWPTSFDMTVPFTSRALYPVDFINKAEIVVHKPRKTEAKKGRGSAGSEKAIAESKEAIAKAKAKEVNLSKSPLVQVGEFKPSVKKMKRSPEPEEESEPEKKRRRPGFFHPDAKPVRPYQRAMATKEKISGVTDKVNDILSQALEEQSKIAQKTTEDPNKVKNAGKKRPVDTRPPYTMVHLPAAAGTVPPFSTFPPNHARIPTISSVPSTSNTPVSPKKVSTNTLRPILPKNPAPHAMVTPSLRGITLYPVSTVTVNGNHIQTKPSSSGVKILTTAPSSTTPLNNSKYVTAPSQVTAASSPPPARPVPPPIPSRPSLSSPITEMLSPGISQQTVTQKVMPTQKASTPVDIRKTAVSNGTVKKNVSVKLEPVVKELKCLHENVDDRSAWAQVERKCRVGPMLNKEKVHKLGYYAPRSFTVLQLSLVQDLINCAWVPKDAMDLLRATDNGPYLKVVVDHKGEIITKKMPIFLSKLSMFLYIKDFLISMNCCPNLVFSTEYNCDTCGSDCNDGELTLDSDNLPEDRAPKFKREFDVLQKLGARLLDVKETGEEFRMRLGDNAADLITANEIDSSVLPYCQEEVIRVHMGLPHAAALRICAVAMELRAKTFESVPGIEHMKLELNL